MGIQMAWHMGHPLSQTLFTSIYIDKLLSPAPKTIEDARFDRVQSESPLVSVALRAYCLALVKSCDLVHTRVAAEYYYEVSHHSIVHDQFSRYLSRRKKILLRNYTTEICCLCLTHRTSTACWTRRSHGWMRRRRLMKSFEMPFGAGYCFAASF